MERHTPRDYTHPETGKTFQIKERPEAEGINNAFGSAFHDCAEVIETEVVDIDTAVRMVFPRYSQWLNPGDLALLKKDLAALASRDYRGVRTVVAEDDLRVPLFEHKGQTIYFRFKLDKLYQSIQNPGQFIQIDYKSSKWKTSEEEWNKDIQQSAYNWGTHEVYPEIEDLMQVVDQLRYGPVILNRKTNEDREETKDFLIECAVALLEDEDYLPTHNQWCPWCPLKTDCPVIGELTEFAQATVAVIAPVEKVGRKNVTNLEALSMEKYAVEMHKADDARKVLEAFVKAVKGSLKGMSEEDRRDLGYGLATKRAYWFETDVLPQVHEELGDADFYRLIDLPKTRLESNFKDDPDLLARLLGLMQEGEGGVSVIKV